MTVMIVMRTKRNINMLFNISMNLIVEWKNPIFPRDIYSIFYLPIAMISFSIIWKMVVCWRVKKNSDAHWKYYWKKQIDFGMFILIIYRCQFWDHARQEEGEIRAAPRHKMCLGAFIWQVILQTDRQDIPRRRGAPRAVACCAQGKQAPVLPWHQGMLPR